VILAVDGAYIGFMEKMKTAIELHDSECVSIVRDPSGDGVVVLNAYVHRYEGEFGRMPHEGGEQRIRIAIGSMTVVSETGPLPSTIYDSSLIVGESIFDNLVPLPAKHAGSVNLTMTLSDDAREVKITGEGIEIVAEGAFRFIESVDFSN